jgi:LacI family transcriptional regulator
MVTKKALEKKQYTIWLKTSLHLWKNVTFQEGIDFAKQIIEEHPDVDGIFAITDLVAVGVLFLF